MAMFLGDLAFAVELIAIALGFMLFYFAKKEGAKLLKVSGYILVIGGILTASCTGYFLTKYYLDGHFDKPYPQHSMMKHKMMGEKGCMMTKEKMKSCMSDGGCPHMKEMMKKCGAHNQIKMESKSDATNHEAHH